MTFDYPLERQGQRDWRSTIALQRSECTSAASLSKSCFPDSIWRRLTKSIPKLFQAQPSSSLLLKVRRNFSFRNIRIYRCAAREQIKFDTLIIWSLLSQFMQKYFHSQLARRTFVARFPFLLWAISARESAKDHSQSEFLSSSQFSLTQNCSQILAPLFSLFHSVRRFEATFTRAHDLILIDMFQFSFVSHWFHFGFEGSTWQCQISAQNFIT